MKKMKQMKVRETQVYFEVYAFGAGVIGNCDTLEQAIEYSKNSGSRIRISKVTKEVLEVGR